MLTPRQIAKIRASVLRSLKAEVERQAEYVYKKDWIILDYDEFVKSVLNEQNPIYRELIKRKKGRIMTMQMFIDENRGELDRLIRNAIGNPNADIDDDERELWINNDEGLYSWAIGEGLDPDNDE